LDKTGRRETEQEASDLPVGELPVLPKSSR